MIKEEWKDVVGFEGFYKVSNYGRIKSVDRTVLRKNGIPCHVNEKILNYWHHNGYERAGLRKPDYYEQFFVHRIVAAAFIGCIPEGMEVCHQDGDRKNNRPENLRYGTRSDNVIDAIRHGTHYTPYRAVGEDRKISKINNDIVRQIRASSESSTVLADRFKISQTLVKSVKRRTAWAHVT